MYIKRNKGGVKMFGFNKILIKTLKNTINELEKDLENQKYINKIHEHNEVILLEKNSLSLIVVV